METQQAKGLQMIVLPTALLVSTVQQGDQSVAICV